MKKTYLSALGMSGLFLLSISTGCKKDSGSSSGTALTATVNGKSFNAKVVSGLHVVSSQLIEIGGLQISNGDTTSIEIVVPDTLHLNVPYASEDEISDLDYNDLHTQTDYSGDFGGHGAVTVTAWDSNKHTISGHFSGVFVNTMNSADSVTVANGSFNTSYNDTP